MIIDPTDFTDRPYKVPNQEESRDFISFIEETEEQLATGNLTGEVCNLLGDELWHEFNDQITGSGVIEERFELLRDGEIYTYNNKQYHYKGWVEMIRPAIFSLWLPQSNMKLTNIGYVENSAPQQSKLMEDQYQFQVNHWNKFVSKVGYSYPYGYNCHSTFYGFMKVHATDFPTWTFRCPRYKNRYDL